jgi:peptidoglycan-N-acetylglucosamine deacetylase
MRGLKNTLLRRRVLWPVGILLLVVLFLSVVIVIHPRFVVKQLADQNPDILFFAKTDQKVLALTIDDAPSSLLTPAILDLFAKHDIRATFFVIGDHAAGQEKLLQRMKAAGHELGNHMMQDEASIHLDEAEFEQGLLAVEAMIGPLGTNKWCRPGSGWFTPEMLETGHKYGYRFCLGSIYPFDNFLRHPDLIRRAVLARVQPGAVLVLHEGDARRNYIIPLLEKLIPALKAKGYRFLTVSELYALQDTVPVTGSR